MVKYLSIDIGGTYVKYSIFDSVGNMVSKDKLLTVQDKKIFLQRMDKIIAKYNKISGIAICAPGQIINNIIHYGGSLGFLDGMDFSKRYAKLNIPIAVVNDGKASVLSENWVGNLKNISNCACLTLGTGIGGGIIVNGELVSGMHAQAGELSFMRFSTFPESHAMAGYTFSAMQMINDINALANNTDLKDGIAAFKEINNHNEDAVKIFHSFCSGIATIIFNIQTVLDLEKISIGGGISAQPIVIKGIQKAYDHIFDNNPLIKQMLTKTVIVPAKYGNDANLYGALYNLLLQQDN